GRAACPPGNTLILGITTCCQLVPPLRLTPATRPRAPPLDQRSCCQMPAMLSGSVGLTSIHGSTSLLRTTVPAWSAPPPAVQPRNALVPETWTSGPCGRGPADAGATVASPIARLAVTTRTARCRMTRPLFVHFPFHDRGTVHPANQGVGR